MALKRFSAWLVAEDLIDADPLAGLSPPQLDTLVIERLTDAQCGGLPCWPPTAAILRSPSQHN